MSFTLPKYPSRDKDVSKCVSERFQKEVAEKSTMELIKRSWKRALLIYLRVVHRYCHTILVQNYLPSYIWQKKKMMHILYMLVTHKSYPCEDIQKLWECHLGYDISKPTRFRTHASDTIVFSFSPPQLINKRLCSKVREGCSSLASTDSI